MRVATHRQDAVALETAAGPTTFGELARRAEALAELFLRAGAGGGQVVGLSLGDPRRFLEAFLALARLDATVALLSPLYRESELRGISERVPLSCVVADEFSADQVVDAVGGRALDAAPFELVAVSEDRTRLEVPAPTLKCTSGSTAEPKIVAVGADNVLAAARNLAATLCLRAGNRLLAPVPLHHSYGFEAGVSQMLFTGTTLAVPASSAAVAEPRALADGVDVFVAAPTHYRLLLGSRDEIDLSGVRWLLSCTAPLSAAAVTSFAERFGAAISQHYGTSETGGISVVSPRDALAHPRSVGRPLAGVEVAVVDEAGRRSPPGAVGEVVVSGAAVALGYVGADEDGGLANGAFHTQDRGVLDADGFLTLLGRRDDVMNVGGLKVARAEVASVLELHPAVRAAAVTAVRDGVGEEVVRAVVALRRALDERELIAFCRDRLAPHKIPRTIELREPLRRGWRTSRTRPGR